MQLSKDVYEMELKKKKKKELSKFSLSGKHFI